MAHISGLRSLLGIGILAHLGCIASPALAGSEEHDPLQIYGLTLDETRLGDGFCESRVATRIVHPECARSKQSLPEIADIEVQTMPAPYVILTFTAAPDDRREDVRIWYAPREQGGQSFVISTTTHVDRNLAGARESVLASFGAPTVEFSHADMEARGIHVSDLTVDTLLYVDRALPEAQWTRVAHRLRTEFEPTGPELFSLTNTRLRALAQLLGSDFRGAIVQVSESGWSHDSTVATILLDLDRARSVFRLMQ